MSTATIPTTTGSPVVFSDLIPRAKVRNVALVIGFALLTAALAQVRVHLPWTPVPMTGQTLAVLVAGGALGWRLGAMSQIVYLLLGIVGLPFFTGGESGWEYATGATFGYLVGFILAAAVVGLLAERLQDRNVLTAVPAMLFGAAVVHVVGIPWLAHSVGVSAERAVALGLAPFIVGDFLKAVLAGVLFPTAWRLARREGQAG